ncbi:MAG: class I mannose-6-phosphate isomerase [Clostridiales bacterium]|nr:class I mannose-6-phosphate isomerase [Clostridiales bacterium]
MPHGDIYPLELEPVLKDIIWGGERLKNEFGFSTQLEKIAEAWVLTCRPEGENKIINGSLAGMSLGEYLARNSSDALGSASEKYGEFPLLIKLIDAKKDLSVQVHPDDDYARRVENSFGKTEAWYILDCDEGARLIYGFKDKISKEQFRRAIENNTLMDCVNTVSVKKGDVFFIDAGTLHAIGGGILLAEVQQNCNTTYRVYDYNRLENGKPRELHVDKAVDVTVTEPPRGDGKPEGEPTDIGGCELTQLASCEFFSMELIKVKTGVSIEPDGTTFVSLLVLSGEGMLRCGDTQIELKKGTSVFVPAKCPRIKIEGKTEILRSML